jgi:hypothetical protein
LPENEASAMIWVEGSCLAKRTLKSCFSAMWNLGFEWGEAHHPVMTHLVCTLAGQPPKTGGKGENEKKSNKR